jgi:hypothetical protein
MISRPADATKQASNYPPLIHLRGTWSFARSMNPLDHDADVVPAVRGDPSPNQQNETPCPPPPCACAAEQYVLPWVSADHPRQLAPAAPRSMYATNTGRTTSPVSAVHLHCRPSHSNTHTPYCLADFFFDDSCQGLSRCIAAFSVTRHWSVAPCATEPPASASRCPYLGSL